MNKSTGIFCIIVRKSTLSLEDSGFNSPVMKFFLQKLNKAKKNYIYYNIFTKLKKYIYLKYFIQRALLHININTGIRYFLNQHFLELHVRLTFYLILWSKSSIWNKVAAILNHLSIKQNLSGSNWAVFFNMKQMWIQVK